RGEGAVAGVGDHGDAAVRGLHDLGAVAEGVGELVRPGGVRGDGLDADRAVVQGLDGSVGAAVGRLVDDGAVGGDLAVGDGDLLGQVDLDARRAGAEGDRLVRVERDDGGGVLRLGGDRAVLKRPGDDLALVGR